MFSIRGLMSWLVLTLLSPSVAGLPRRKCENATVPSPRTKSCSIRNGIQLEAWFTFQQKLVTEASAHIRSSRPRLLLLGDSITEAFRGTAVGKVIHRTTGLEAATAVLTAYLPASAQPPLIIAISGDETQHLLWRLRSRELTATMADSNLVVSLMIGSNNIDSAQHRAEDTVLGILAIAHELLSHPRVRLLINALLPSGQDPRKKKYQTHQRLKADPKANLMPKIDRTNHLLYANVRGLLSTQFPGRVRMVDCGEPYRSPPGEALATPNTEVRADLMPDGDHLSIGGQRLLADCVSKALRPWLVTAAD